MLRVFQGVMHGPEVEDVPPREDMSALEVLALAPIVIAIVLLGVDPRPVLSATGAATKPAAAADRTFVRKTVAALPGHWGTSGK
jgi:NADH:ubiquinone oxidoreductase subunit 4 (subunit M)